MSTAWLINGVTKPELCSLLTALPTLLGALGCAGGQTGEEEDGACALDSVELAADEPASFGLTPRQVLGDAEGHHVAAFAWLPLEGRSYGPESGDSELELSITPLGRAHELAPSSTMPGCCERSLQVAVRVTLRTAGGALDETFDAAVFGSAVSSSTLFHHIKPRELQGDFELDALAPGERFQLLQLTARFDQGTFGGAVSAGIEAQGPARGADGVSSYTLMPLLQWGSPASIRTWCSSPP